MPKTKPGPGDNSRPLSKRHHAPWHVPYTASQDSPMPIDVMGLTLPSVDAP